MVKNQTDESATVVMAESKPEDARREEKRTQLVSGADAGGVAEDTATSDGTDTRGRTGADVLGDLDELSSAPSRPLAEGDTLNGRFVLEQRLGGGGMGTVYKALDLRKQEAMDRNPYIAIKVLNEEFRTHPESFKSLQREAKKAQSLAHPNIVTVYDFDRDGAAIYMTMELQDGQPLNEIIRASKFKGMPVQEAVRIVDDIGTALAYAHEKRIVHSDLKPGNVFLTDRGQAKVFDFGIARASKKEGSDADTTLFDAGSLGALTPSYASPEMLERGDPDPRDDIYALACIAYELLTGKHPFDRVPATQARDNQLRAKQPANLTRRQWVAIQNGLAFERERRTPSVKRFLHELSAVGPSRVRQAPYAVAAMALIVAAVAAGFYILWRSDTPRRPPLQVIRALLINVPCARIEARVSAGTVRLSGYARARSDLSRLRQALLSIPGVNDVEIRTNQIEKNLCAPIDFFSPYTETDRNVARGLTIRTKNDSGEFVEGDKLIVNLTAPNYDSYIYVDYFALDGSVIHLRPQTDRQQNLVPKDKSITLGDIDSAKQWTIAPPFGTEFLVVLAASKPVFESVRDEVERQDEYLQALGRNLDRITVPVNNKKIVADILFIATKSNK